VNSTTPTATPTKQQRTRDVLSTPTKLGGNGNPSTTPSRPLTGGLNFATIGKQSVVAANTGATTNDEGVPGWISTTIRHICKKLEIPAAIPHIYVGVATLLKSSSSTIASPTKAQARTPKTGRGVLDDAVSSRVSAETENTVKIPALIIVVMLLVVKRMYPANGNVNVRSVSHELVALGRVTSKRLREVMMECERLEEDEKEMERWEGMEWFGNVPVGEEEGEGEDESGDVEMVDGRDELDHGDGNGDRIVVKRTVAPAATPSLKTAQVQVQAAAISTPTTKHQPPPPPPAAEPAQRSLQPPPPPPPQRTPRPKSSTPRNAGDIRPTGLGAIDWLSPARRAECEKWKANMFRRLAEKEGGQHGVDTRTNRATAGRKRKADVLSSPAV